LLDILHLLLKIVGNYNEKLLRILYKDWHTDNI